MLNSTPVVLPDTLVAQLIANAASLSDFLYNDFEQVLSLRQSLRQQMLVENRLIRLNQQHNQITNAYAIDGAHIVEIDRASAYSISCAVKVGQNNQANGQSSCLASLPHVASINSLSSGLMMMQEIMMAVENIENDPNTVSFIDGSRISTIISIESFYSGIARDLANQLTIWRRNAGDQSDREPGRTLRLFESRDWLTPFLTDSRIIGNLKLVTTNILVNQYTPQWIGRLDDKTFASLILEPGEIIEPIAIQPPDEPYHIHNSYPFSRNIREISDSLTRALDPHQIFHIYYRPDENHGVYKIELNQSTLANERFISDVFSWWNSELQAPDLQEPYSYFIADRFAKEAVSVAKNALGEITKRRIDPNSTAWSFLQPYRTE